MPGFQAASLTDIALMKLVAVIQRGARKDFIDVHAHLVKCFNSTNVAMYVVSMPENDFLRTGLLTIVYCDVDRFDLQNDQWSVVFEAGGGIPVVFVPS
ncbi:MAG: hypothetical protein ACYCYO_02805 [Bacilli bacterium]